jgi:GT2 family glycosyltransferase
MTRLLLSRSETGDFNCAVPLAVRNRWCVLVLRSAGQRRDMPARVRLRMAGDPMSSFETYVPAPGLFGALPRIAVIYIASTAVSLHLDMFGVDLSVDGIMIDLVPVSRAIAAAVFALRDPKRLLHTLQGDKRGFVRRARTALALLAGTPSGERSYSLWIELFETPTPASFRLPPSFGVVVLHPDGKDDALNATLASLAGLNPTVVTGTDSVAWRQLEQGLAASDMAFIAVLQAGETLHPGASDAIATAIADNDAAEAIFADEDALDVAGQRHGPLFKPEANHSLMLSGILTRGVWIFRHDALMELMTAPRPGPLWAEALRLDAWLRLYDRPVATRTVHLPFILTHRSPGTLTAPVGVLAEVVGLHLRKRGLPATVGKDTFPLIAHFSVPAAEQSTVSIVVPTAARSPHVTECLLAVLAQTDYSAFEILIVLSQSRPPDEQQMQVLEPVLRDARARLVWLEVESFNFSAVNNFGVGRCQGELICLLNDDVAPMRADWLSGMAGHLADARIGAVGAKLYYPNRTIQHAGVIIGVAGLASHANRMLAQGEPGYASRAILNQELSAVTGACLLVRRSLYDALGGLDEAYPIAFNDVDFCLRIREAGYGIVFSAQTEMWHYESVSLGHHFAGARAAQEAAELLAMRTRWADVCRNDPFHNPNLSQERGAEWELAFPPRLEGVLNHAANRP